MKAKVPIIILLFCFSFSVVSGQVRLGNRQDTIPVRLDTVPNLVPDSTLQVLDSLDQPGRSEITEVFYSKDSLEAPVDYAAQDSMIYDIKEQKIHLYGNANVNYTTISLNAAYIVYDWQSNIVTAQGMPDSTGKMAGFPQFKDGTQEFTAKRMQYNFLTQRGIVYDVRTDYNDVVVRGKKSKFVSGQGRDSAAVDDIIFSQNAIFTTCDHPEPHFWN